MHLNGGVHHVNGGLQNHVNGGMQSYANSALHNHVNGGLHRDDLTIDGLDSYVEEKPPMFFANHTGNVDIHNSSNLSTLV